jgi:hypothetical protein
VRNRRLASPLAALAVLLLGANFSCNPLAPPLLSSLPADGATGVSRATWIDLRFASPLHPVLPIFALRCLGEAADHPLTAHRLAPDRVILNPAGALPAGDDCELVWREQVSPSAWELARVAFSTAPAGLPVRVRHDRSDPGTTGPYPDDYYLAPDPSTETGFRHAYPLPDRAADLQTVYGALLTEANLLDGFSPIAHMVVEFSDPLDPASLPSTPADSLDPLASVALLDLSPTSPTFGARVPFRLELRNGDVTSLGLAANTMLIFPSIPLEPKGRYGLVVTRRAQSDPGRPLDPSAFFAAALAPPAPGEPPSLARTRELADDVLEVASLVARPPIPRDDVAFAARISVRSTDSIQDDVQLIKRHVLAAPPPAVTIDFGSPTAVVPDSNANVAALVRGTWAAPNWRNGAILARDGQGDPVLTGTKDVCFRLALPAAALDGPVPVVIYQHGNPGESETEVLRNARNFLAQAGYAVIGFTDVLNREVAPPASPAGPACLAYETAPENDEGRLLTQVFDIVLGLLSSNRISDHWTQTLADQLAFVRVVEGLADLDLLPLGSPDGVPDLDTSRLLYHGISEGGNNGQAFVAYAPEVRAAALMVGGARLMEVLIHQQAATFLGTLPQFFQSLTPADIWAATAIFQADFDRQDKHNHGRFTYRSPAEVPLSCDDLASCLDPGWCETPGNCTQRKPSVLLVEGLTDSLVPNHTTDSAAFQLGPIPHLAPVQNAVPFLDVVEDSVAGNIDAETTAAFYQYVPVGVPGVAPTPGCKSPPLSQTSSTEGHYCAQGAVESRAQRLIFFATALDPGRSAPTIVDPLPYYPEGTPLFPLPDPLP